MSIQNNNNLMRYESHAIFKEMEYQNVKSIKGKNGNLDSIKIQNRKSNGMLQIGYINKY